MNPWADLTILLPLKDRVDYSRRWLDYAAVAPLPCRILIADGGSTSEVAALAAEARARHLDVDYVRYPFDADYAAYYGKIADALQRVTTPYVVLADNDDFFVPDGVQQAVTFLQANPDYIACGGQCAIFWLRGRGAPAAPQALYGSDVEWKASSRLLTDTGETAERRLRERSVGAHEVFYCVQRTELLRRHFAAVRDCNPRDLFLMPHLLMFLTAIAGKTRQLETLYLVRQQDSPGSSGGAHESEFGDWLDRMLVPTWSADFGRFVDCAATALAAADQMPEERARRLVIAAYKAATAPSVLSDVLEEPTVSWSMPLVLQMVRRIVRLPERHPVRRFMQAAYRRAHWLSNDLVYGVELRTRRSRHVARELAPVAEFLKRGRRQSS